MNIFKSLMRLGGNAHFVSNIFLGIALAAFVNLVFIYWFQRDKPLL